MSRHNLNSEMRREMKMVHDAMASCLGGEKFTARGQCPFFNQDPRVHCFFCLVCFLTVASVTYTPYYIAKLIWLFPSQERGSQQHDQLLDICISYSVMIEIYYF